jgi:polyketide cyclase/dehydrase/lipid transport protein
MKALSATATASTSASLHACFALLSAIDRYPDWYPEGVKSAEVTERGDDGLPIRGRTVLQITLGPFARDFPLEVSVIVRWPETITISRLPEHAGDHEHLDVIWRLREQSTGTAIEVALDAELAVPPLLPVGGVADSIARGFVEAAARAL